MQTIAFSKIVLNNSVNQQLQKLQIKNAWKLWFSSIFKADNGTRTRDLRITNATLYHLSYISRLTHRRSL